MAFNFKINPYTYDNPKVITSDGIKVDDTQFKAGKASTEGLAQLQESSKSSVQKLAEQVTGGSKSKGSSSGESTTTASSSK